MSFMGSTGLHGVPLPVLPLLDVGPVLPLLEVVFPPPAPLELELVVAFVDDAPVVPPLPFVVAVPPPLLQATATSMAGATRKAIRSGQGFIPPAYTNVTLLARVRRAPRRSRLGALLGLLDGRYGRPAADVARFTARA
jgi:hypothetical protein